MKKVLLLFAFIIIGSASVFAQIQPDARKTEEMKQRGPCRDPWITWAHLDASASIYDAVGFGDYGECNPKLYNNGSWANYTELYNAVREYRKSLQSAGVSWQRVAQPNGTIAFFATIDGEKYGVIGKGLEIKNGKLVAAGGGNLVAAGGGNLVGNDGASLVAAGGGNLVAAGGGNVVPTGGGSYTLQSGEKKRIKIGKNTYLVVKK